MDKTTLVRNDLEILGRVLDALNRARIPATLVEWNYVSEIEEWRLVIGTPLYDSIGPLKAYSRVIEALQQAEIYEEVPMLRVSVLSADDSVVKGLKQEVKDRTEGNILITDYAHNKPNHEKPYSVVFTPYAGRGGAVPAKHLTGLVELRKFLEQDLHIKKISVEEALLELARKGYALIPNVQLTNRKAKALGLA